MNFRETSRVVNIDSIVRTSLSDALKSLNEKKIMTFLPKNIKKEMEYLLISAFVLTDNRNYSDFLRTRKLPDGNCMNDFKKATEKILLLYQNMKMCDLKRRTPIYIRNAVYLFCGEPGGYLKYTHLYHTDDENFKKEVNHIMKKSFGANSTVYLSWCEKHGYDSAHLLKRKKQVSNRQENISTKRSRKNTNKQENIEKKRKEKYKQEGKYFKKERNNTKKQENIAKKSKEKQ